MGDQLQNRVLNGTNQCECLPGYFDNFGYICQMCHWRCKTCKQFDADGRNKCESCNSAWNRELVDVGGYNECQCKFGFVDVNSASCIPCNQKCAGCQNGDPGDCINCVGGLNRVDNPTENCPCMDGFFFDGTNAMCQQCNRLCSKCFPQDLCIECVDAVNRDKDQNCICRDKTKYSSEAAGLCDQDCSYKYDRCEDVTGSPIACSDASRDFDNDCNCSPGFYDDGVSVQCQKCNNSKCGTCEQVSDNCIVECQEGCISCNIDGSCIGPNCQDGYQFDSQNNKCIIIKCTNNCEECDQNGKCIVCRDSNTIGDQCQNCKEGFFKNQDQECQRCKYPCLECEGSEDNCLSCSSLFNRNQGDCSCQPRYGDNGQECIQCEIQNCLKCQFDQNGQEICQQKEKALEEVRIEAMPDMGIEIPVCDPMVDKKAMGKNCAQCDPYSYDCTQCHKNSNRYIKDGKCVCDTFYEEKNSKCILEENESVIQVSTTVSTQVEGQKAIYMAMITTVIISNPSLFISFIESLQFASYNLYIQVDYPQPVVDFLKLFNIFDGGSFPNIVPDHKYIVPSPKGFFNRERDGLLFRNASQYIVLSFILGIVYMIFKIIWVKTVKNKDEEKYNVFNKLVNFVVGKFEYQVLITGVSGSYLNFSVFCLLQLNSIAISEYVQIISLFMAFCIYFLELIYPFFVFRIAQDVLKIQKQINIEKEKLGEYAELKELQSDKYKELLKQKQQHQEKYGFQYELFREDTIIGAGYFIIVCLKKLIFGGVLIFLNNYPRLNLYIFISLCLGIIFVNLRYKPYKFGFFNYFRCIPEILYVVLYSCSLSLLSEDNSDDGEKRKEIPKIMISVFIVIIGVELIIIVVENIRTVVMVVIQLIQKLKQERKEKEKSASNQKNKENKILPLILTEPNRCQRNSMDILSSDKRLCTENNNNITPSFIQQTITENSIISEKNQTQQMFSIYADNLAIQSGKFEKEQGSSGDGSSSSHSKRKLRKYSNNSQQSDQKYQLNSNNNNRRFGSSSLKRKQLRNSRLNINLNSEN